MKILTDLYKQRIKINPQNEVKVIANYFAIINKKLIICHANKNLFEGSYSLSPLFLSLERGGFWKPLESKLIDDLLKYWSDCLLFLSEIF